MKSSCAVAAIPTASPESAAKLVQNLKPMLPKRDDVIVRNVGAVVHFGPEKFVAKPDPNAKPPGWLLSALDAHGQAPLQVILAPFNNRLRKSLEETTPELPNELGGGSIQVLTRGLKWASLEITTNPRTSVQTSRSVCR